jgi:hypothetical protein
MKSTSLLSSKLHTLLSLFKDLSLRYEFKPGQMTHLIEVSPESLLDDDNFINSRISLRDEFENYFPNEEIVFTSTNSLVKIKNPQDIFPEKKLRIGFKNSELVTEPIFSIDLKCDIAYDDNFALAA